MKPLDEVLHAGAGANFLVTYELLRRKKKENMNHKWSKYQARIYARHMSEIDSTMWLSCSAQKFSMFFWEGSSRLRLDYILGKFIIKIRPSVTKPGHRMLASGLKPRLMGYSTTSPRPFASMPPPLWLKFSMFVGDYETICLERLPIWKNGNYKTTYTLDTNLLPCGNCFTQIKLKR